MEVIDEEPGVEARFGVKLKFDLELLEFRGVDPWTELRWELLMLRWEISLADLNWHNSNKSGVILLELEK